MQQGWSRAWDACRAMQCSRLGSPTHRTNPQTNPTHPNPHPPTPHPRPHQASYMVLDTGISPVTFSVGNTMKRVAVVVSSVMFFKCALFWRRGLGLGGGGGAGLVWVCVWAHRLLCWASTAFNGWWSLLVWPNRSSWWWSDSILTHPPTTHTHPLSTGTPWASWTGWAAASPSSAPTSTQWPPTSTRRSWPPRRRGLRGLRGGGEGGGAEGGGLVDAERWSRGGGERVGLRCWLGLLGVAGCHRSQWVVLLF